MGGLTSRCGKRLDTPERAAGATRSLAGRVARARARAQPPWLSEPPRAFGDCGGGMSRTLSAARRQPAGRRRREDGRTPPLRTRYRVAAASASATSGEAGNRAARRFRGEFRPRVLVVGGTTGVLCRGVDVAPRQLLLAAGTDRSGSRRPISGAQLPRPPLVYLVRPAACEIATTLHATATGPGLDGGVLGLRQPLGLRPDS